MESKEIIEKVNTIIKTYDEKLTLRQIYYRLVAANVIPNNLNSYKGLGKILVKARETGKVDHRKIEDRVRKSIGGDFRYWEVDDFFTSYRDQFLQSYKYFRRPRWFNQPFYLEVWVEKDALSRLVSDTADSLCVTTCVARGYSSFTFVKQAADRIRQACMFSDDGIEMKRPKILYFGDFDPSGEDMVRDLSRRLLEYGLADWLEEDPDDPDGEIGDGLVEKLALTPEQIAQYKLPPAPVKMSDSRAIDFVAKHGTGVVELDALEPNLLKAFVKQGIMKFIDEQAWAANIEMEVADTAAVKDKVEEYLAD